MPIPATTREQRLRKTKAQLIDEIDTLEQRVAALDFGREQAFTESEEFLSGVLDNIPAAVVLRDRDGKFIRINRQYEKVYGVTNEAVRGKTLVDLYPKGKVEEYVALDKAVLEHRQAKRTELTVAQPDGDHVFNAINFPIFDADGEIVAIGGIDHDITELKQAEQELARKEAQLRVALDNMPGGMMLGDQDLNYVLFNGQYSKLHDYPEGFLKVGMSLREEARFQVERGDYSPGKKDELVEQLLDLYQGGQATSWERTLPNGRTLRFNMAPTPEGGNATIAADITEIKQAEQAAAEAQALLNDAIDSISEGFALYDADDRLVLCNKTYRDLWGYSDTEAAPGVHWDDLDRLDVERGTVIGEGNGTAGSPWRSALSRRRQSPQSIEIQFTDGPLGDDPRSQDGGRRQRQHPDRHYRAQAGRGGAA